MCTCKMYSKAECDKCVNKFVKYGSSGERVILKEELATFCRRSEPRLMSSGQAPCLTMLMSPAMPSTFLIFKESWVTENSICIRHEQMFPDCGRCQREVIARKVVKQTYLQSF